MALATSSFSCALESCGLGSSRPRNFPSPSFMNVSSRVAKCVGAVPNRNNSRAVEFGGKFVIKAVEAETLVQEDDSDQPGPVSPSDILTMWFQAEGTMQEKAIPTVTKALEEIDGVTNLKVQLIEGIASVELTKETTIQATGVASGLVERIQGSGFKLQTLNLSFLDESETSESD